MASLQCFGYLRKNNIKQLELKSGNYKDALQAGPYELLEHHKIYSYGQSLLWMSVYDIKCDLGPRPLFCKHQ